MRWLLVVPFAALFLTGCDNSRIFESYTDFENRYWVVTEKPVFEFEITDTQARYNIYSNVRNSVAYPFSRFFMTYYLRDSSGNELQKKLSGHTLFDEKSGEPQGSSGLGDIYDHQFLLLRNFEFKNPGKYSMTFEQFMRTDTLEGMLAVGVRVEKVIGE